MSAVLTKLCHLWGHLMIEKVTTVCKMNGTIGQPIAVFVIILWSEYLYCLLYWTSDVGGSKYSYKMYIKFDFMSVSDIVNSLLF